MSRLNAVDPATAPDDAKRTLAAVNAQLGVTPNMFRVAANSTAALNGLVQLSGSLAKGRLNARVREQIALAVAQTNGCDYCLSAHTYLGKHAGLNDDDVRRARSGDAADPKIDAMVRLAVAVVRERGHVGAEAVAQAQAAGISDAEIVEIVGNVALNVFTNYLNVVAGTEIDFPVVHAAELARA